MGEDTGLTPEELRKRRRDRFAAKVGPHKRAGEVRTVDVAAKDGVAAHREFLVSTACGREVPATLSAHQNDRVRCPECRLVIENDMLAADLRDQTSTGRCPVMMEHPSGRPDARCILPASHKEADTDHVDEHGCKGPVLVSQASIDEAARVTAARVRGDIR